MDQQTYIRNVLEYLCEPGQVYELRALDVPRGKGKPAHEAGYFDDLDALAEAATKLDRRGARGVYLTANPVRRDLLARRVNRTEYAKRGEQTQDQDVERRNWLLVDFDPVRPAGISATDDEHELAIERARSVADELQVAGWPEPVLGDSGNGAHLLWRIELENDEAATELLQRVLVELNARFGDDDVAVDRTTFNASRIWKLYGTTARKGDHTEERPHRHARVISYPAEPVALERNQLEAVLPREAPRSQPCDVSDSFDLDAWVRTYLPIADGPEPYSGGRRWVLPVCPWNEAHDDRAAWVIELAGGAISAGCHHNGCRGRDWASLREMLEPEVARVRALVPSDADVAELAGQPPPKPPDEKPHWKAALIYNEAIGKKPPTLKPVFANVVTILGNHPEWAGVLAFDEFAAQTVARKPPPWHQHDAGEAWTVDAPWTDDDDLRASMWLSRHAGLHFSSSIAAAVQVVAKRNTYHPVREYLDGLSWDGEERLSTWMVAYCGAPDDEYTRSVSRWWLVSAVARIFQPGCKADHVLIFEGLQGLGKSSVLRALSEPWFTDTPVEIGTKDAFQALRGKWVVEMAELDAFSRAAATRAKAFFSSAVDSYRPSFGRRTVDFPRQCVFAGSTNDDDYLKDATGGRRYWPVRCTHAFAAELSHDRDQLWAEAVVAYRRGETWWPRTRSAVDLCTEEQEKRYQADAWEEIIRKWLIGQPKQVTIDEVLGSAIGLEKGKMGRSEQMRAAQCMRRLNYVRTQKRDDRDKTKRIWVYERTDLSPTPANGSQMSMETMFPI